MAQVIGVVSGVLGIFSFIQDLFPEPAESPANTFQFRIGLDGTMPPEGGDGLSNAGGNLPDIRCFDNGGGFQNLVTNDNNGCNDGSVACSTQVDSDVPCDYALLTANDDAMCIGWISMTYPDGSDKFGSPIGEWARTCSDQFGAGGTWYWGDVPLPLSDNNQQERVVCAWIDANGDQPITGIQIHWPEFLPQSGGIPADKSLDYYCSNSFALRFLTEPDPTSIVFPAKHRVAREAEMAAARRDSEAQLARLSKRFAADPRVIKSKHAEQTATELCAAKMSVGPSFVSYTERQFCEMTEKKLYSFCDDVEAGACWDDANNTLANKGNVAIRDVLPIKTFTVPVVWE